MHPNLRDARVRLISPFQADNYLRCAGHFDTTSFPSHVPIEPDEVNRLDTTGFALVEQMRAVSSTRCSAARGNVGAAVVWQLTDVLAMIIGIP